MTKTQPTKPASRAARLRARIARLEGKLQRGDVLQQRRKAKLETLKNRLKAMSALVALSISVQVSAPPLSPAEAATVLRSSRSDRNVTDLLLSTPPQLPRVVVVTRPVERPRVPSLVEIPWAARQAVPWRHVAPAAEDPTIRTVRILDR